MQKVVVIFCRRGLCIKAGCCVLSVGLSVPRWLRKLVQEAVGPWGDLRRDPGSALFTFSVAEPIGAQGENKTGLNWAGNQEGGAWPGNTD